MSLKTIVKLFSDKKKFHGYTERQSTIMLALSLCLKTEHSVSAKACTVSGLQDYSVTFKKKPNDLCKGGQQSIG